MKPSDFWLEYASRINEVKKDVKASLDFLLKDIHKDCTILDIGCNNGSFLAYIQSLGYHNLTGMDSNPNAIYMAREYHPDMDFILEDALTQAEHTPFSKCRSGFVSGYRQTVQRFIS